MAEIDKALPNNREKVKVNPEEDLEIEVLNQQNQADPGVDVQENEDGTARVLSNVVSSQIKQHKKFGGIVPEIAARTHIENIDFIIQEALDKSKKVIKDLDGVAATAGPGLVVCLHIGYNIGKSIFLRKKI